MKLSPKRIASSILTLFWITHFANAQDAAPPDSIWQVDIPSVQILGKRTTLLNQLPGSAAFLSTKKLTEMQPLSGNEVLKTVSGVHVTEEEGAGLRINLGIRGLDPDRSSRVLMLEDGVPVALNPYGEPQMYYTPAIERIRDVEVLKGSGQILFGPQTIGGVVNYITADPPENRKGNVRLTIGEGGYFTGNIFYGQSSEKSGFCVNFLRRQADKIGSTWFRQHDLTGKLHLKIDKKSALRFKFSVYDELSNSTYLGLTQTMYDAGNNDFARLAPDDRLDIRRLAGSAIYDYSFSKKFKLQTTAFGYTTTRDWRRQDFKNTPVSNGTGMVWGDPLVANGAVYMQNSNGHRNRQFEVAGVEPRFVLFYRLGNYSSQLNGGVRFLYERAFEQRLNGTKNDAASGKLISDEIRTGEAFSAFAQNRFAFAKSWNLTTGARLESYRYSRDILRISEKDTSIFGEDHIAAFIPGIGLNYEPHPSLTVFAGVHRGFSPPRAIDAISNAGEVYHLQPEWSWNGELGVRGMVKGWFNYEVAAFAMDFNNQIIPISESSGGTGAGLANGGSTLHYGIEGGYVMDFSKWLKKMGIVIKWDGNFTFVKSFFNEDRFVKIGDSSLNINGNRTPYAPEILFNTALTAELKNGIGIRAGLFYTGDQFTDEINSEQAPADGRSGKMPAFFQVTSSVFYAVKKWNARISLDVKNLTDERYVASRRPQGIRVSLPRMAFLTMNWGL